MKKFKRILACLLIAVVVSTSTQVKQLITAGGTNSSSQCRPNGLHDSGNA